MGKLVIWGIFRFSFLGREEIIARAVLCDHQSGFEIPGRFVSDGDARAGPASLVQNLGELTRRDLDMRHIATLTRQSPFPAKAQLAPLYPLGIFVGLWYNTIGLIIERLKQVSLENE